MSRESEKLFDAITQVDEDLLPAERRPKRKLPSWRALAAAAAILAIILSPFVIHIGSRGMTEEAVNGAETRVLAQPVYPVMAAYPGEDGGSDGDYKAWWADIQKQTIQPEGYADSLRGFFGESIRTFLSGADGENCAYSPANVYMALAMLSEAAGGESRAQILALLGADSIDALRTQAGRIWNANYRDDGLTKSLLASSLWLRNGTEYNQQTLDTLAQNYYASVFCGEMGSNAYNRMLQEWLDEQTGGLLTKQASQERFSPDTTLGLASTICFEAQWEKSFSEQETAKGVFRAPGGEEQVPFMHQTEMMTEYCRGDRFGAVALPLKNGGRMWLLLPDAGVTPEALLQDDDALRLMAGEAADTQTALVNLALPKFDLSSRISLLDGLKDMGVRDILDPEQADFSPVQADSAGLYLTDASHAVRVAIDEEGVAAAAYTVMAVGEAAPVADLLIDFTLDRPFLYVITGHADVPLFTGIVNSIE